MAAGRPLRLLIPRPVRTLPADLVGVIVLVVAANVAVFALAGTPVQPVLGLPFVLLAPGYALVAVLFPERAGGENDGGIDLIERVALSAGLSVAVVPVVGLVLNAVPGGLRPAPVVVTLSILTLATVGLAAHRRRSLPADERFELPVRRWLAATRTELFEPDSGREAVLNVLLVVSLLVAVASVGYAVAIPKQGESFTELYLLAETDDGELVADGYPTNLTVGESAPVVVGVHNREHRQLNYTVVVQLQRVERVDNETRVRETREVDRFQLRLAHNESHRSTVELAPSLSGERLRYVFLLYRGGPPAEPTVDSAYRWTSLYVNVSEAG